MVINIEGTPQLSAEAFPDSGEVDLSPEGERRRIVEAYGRKFAPHIPLDNPGLERAALVYSRNDDLQSVE